MAHCLQTLRTIVEHFKNHRSFVPKDGIGDPNAIALRGHGFKSIGNGVEQL